MKSHNQTWFFSSSCFVFVSPNFQFGADISMLVFLDCSQAKQLLRGYTIFNHSKFKPILHGGVLSNLPNKRFAWWKYEVWTLQKLKQSYRRLRYAAIGPFVLSFCRKIACESHKQLNKALFASDAVSNLSYQARQDLSKSFLKRRRRKESVKKGSRHRAASLQSLRH